MEVSGQLHAPGHFTARENFPGNYWIGGWVVTRAGLEAAAKKRNS